MFPKPLQPPKLPYTSTANTNLTTPQPATDLSLGGPSSGLGPPSDRGATLPRETGIFNPDNQAKPAPQANIEISGTGRKPFVPRLKLLALEEERAQQDGVTRRAPESNEKAPTSAHRSSSSLASPEESESSSPPPTAGLFPGSMSRKSTGEEPPRAMTSRVLERNRQVPPISARSFKSDRSQLPPRAWMLASEMTESSRQSVLPTPRYQAIPQSWYVSSAPVRQETEILLQIREVIIDALLSDDTQAQTINPQVFSRQISVVDILAGPVADLFVGNLCSEIDRSRQINAYGALLKQCLSDGYCDALAAWNIDRGTAVDALRATKPPAHRANLLAYADLIFACFPGEHHEWDAYNALKTQSDNARKKPQENFDLTNFLNAIQEALTALRRTLPNSQNGYINYERDYPPEKIQHIVECFRDLDRLLASVPENLRSDERYQKSNSCLPKSQSIAEFGLVRTTFKEYEQAIKAVKELLAEQTQHSHPQK